MISIKIADNLSCKKVADFSLGTLLETFVISAKDFEILPKVCLM